MKKKLLKFALPLVTVASVATPVVSITSCGPSKHLHHYSFKIDFFKVSERLSVWDKKIRLKESLSDYYDIEVKVDYKNITIPAVLRPHIFTQSEVENESYLSEEKAINIGVNLEGLSWPVRDPEKIKEGAKIVVPVKLKCFSRMLKEKTIWTEYARIAFIYEKH